MNYSFSIHLFKQTPITSISQWRTVCCVIGRKIALICVTQPLHVFYRLFNLLRRFPHEEFWQVLFQELQRIVRYHAYASSNRK